MLDLKSILDLAALVRDAIGGEVDVLRNRWRSVGDPDRDPAPLASLVHAIMGVEREVDMMHFVIVNVDGKPCVYQYDTSRSTSQDLKYVAALSDLIDVWRLSQDD